MNRPVNNPDRHDGMIAGLLWYGTLIASAVIGAGIFLGVLDPLDPSLELAHIGYHLVMVGVVIFVLLPVARVALMFVMFLHARDHAYTAISALVLVIIGLGLVSGL